MLSSSRLLVVSSIGLCLLACSSTPVRLAADAAVPAAGDAAADRQSPADARVETLPGGDAATADEAARDVTAADATTSKDASSGEPQTAEVPASKDSNQETPVDAPLPNGDARDAPSTDDLMRDATSDLPFVCSNLPAGPPSCNDDSVSSAIQGECQADGTCKCNPGYVLNPNTGRCGYRRWDASVAGSDSAAAMCTGPYDSCMCSCCGITGKALACYYPTLGETTASLKAADDARWASVICGSGGCSSGTRYVCCTPADPEPSSSATYAVDGYPGGFDHLWITKAGADCASMSLVGGSGGTSAFRIETAADWSATSASFGPCGDASSPTQASGALGTLAFRASGSDCLMDLHATLFAVIAATEVKTARIDADGVPVPQMMARIACRGF